MSAKQLLAKYEQIARENQPDWAEFVSEAKADPATIAYEVAECADQALSGHEFDVVYAAAITWVYSLNDGNA